MQSMQQNWNSSYLFGANSDFIEELYELYLDNPASVEPKWKTYFDTLQDGGVKDVNHNDIKQKFSILTSNPILSAANSDVMSSSQVNVHSLIDAYRVWGHKFAKLDPLKREVLERPVELRLDTYGLSNELENEFYNDYDLRKARVSKLKDIVAHYEEIYCGNTGFEFSYVSDVKEHQWLLEKVEDNYLTFKLNPEEQKQVFQKLT